MPNKKIAENLYPLKLRQTFIEIIMEEEAKFSEEEEASLMAANLPTTASFCALQEDTRVF